MATIEVTLIDTNVLIDIASNDPVWGRWSLNQLQDALLTGPAVINPVIYAEFSARYTTLVGVEDFLRLARIEVDEIPREALFLSGQAFLKYRRTSGTKTGVLPDFFIGAHAAVLGTPLLTRDARRYRSYFPSLELITPDTN